MMEQVIWGRGGDVAVKEWSVRAQRLAWVQLCGINFFFIVLPTEYSGIFTLCRSIKNKKKNAAHASLSQCPRRCPSTPVGAGVTARPPHPSTTHPPAAMSTFKFSYGGKGLQKNQFTNRATSSVWPFISDTPPLSPVLTVHDIPLICLMKI